MAFRLRDGQSVIPDGPFDTDDSGSIRQAALNAAGIAYQLRMTVTDFLADGRWWNASSPRDACSARLCAACIRSPIADPRSSVHQLHDRETQRSRFMNDTNPLGRQGIAAAPVSSGGGAFDAAMGICLGRSDRRRDSGCGMAGLSPTLQELDRWDRRNVGLQVTPYQFGKN